MSASAAFRALHERGVPYCLWRGTPRLEGAWSGSGDFDLLVAPNALEAAGEALAATGAKLARTAPWRTAPGLHDWLALARPVGPLHHLHVHEALLVGEPRLYRFRLPFEEQVLARRRPVDSPHCERPLWFADPADEAALLLLRAALQLRGRDRLPTSGAGAALQAKLDHDLRRLMLEVSIHEGRARAAIAERIEAWIGTPGASAAGAPLADLPRVDVGRLGPLRRATARAVAATTSQGDLAAAFEGGRRATAAVRRRLGARGLGPLPTASRSGPGGAVSIAFEGEPRTARRLVKSTAKVLASKLDVRAFDSGGTFEQRVDRARAARERGWIALVAAEPGERAAAAEAMPLFAIPPERPFEEQLERALTFVWDQL